VRHRYSLPILTPDRSDRWGGCATRISTGSRNGT